MAPIVHRHGEDEQFEERKLYASIYHSAREAGYHEREAEDVAGHVTDEIVAMLDRRASDTVSSREIRAEVIQLLEDEDPAVATVYQASIELF